MTAQLGEVVKVGPLIFLVTWSLGLTSPNKGRGPAKHRATGLVAVFEIAVVLVLIALNGFFALSEFAVVSARHSRLRALAQQGRRGANHVGTRH